MGFSSSKKGPQKRRVDQLLVQRGLMESREKARRLLLTGDVLVNEFPMTKPGTRVPVNASIRIRGEELPYVSRAALKLKQALQAFVISSENRVVLDIGASTGGFAELLIEQGVKKIYAVDVGTHQLAWKLRQQSRIIPLENTNARYLKWETIGEKVDIITIDVSFISLRKILPALMAFAHPETDWITLIKPQFEAGSEEVEKGGVIRDQRTRQKIVDSVKKEAEKLGLVQKGLIDSPVKGSRGNQEYLAYWQLDRSQSSLS